MGIAAYRTKFFGGLLVISLAQVSIWGTAVADTFSTVYKFSNGVDGSLPGPGTLVQASDGNFYGSSIGTTASGSEFGTIFQLTPAGAFKTIYTEQEGVDNAWPGIFVQGKDGNLYGVTHNGGNLSACANVGCGTVFKMTTAGVKTVLYTFTGGTDGGHPFTLIQGSDGFLYGATLIDGASTTGCQHNGCGTVFKMSTSGTITTLYSFSGNDGAYSSGGSLIEGSDGNLYGVTYTGQYSNCTTSSCGNGTAFKLTPSGALTTLHDFSSYSGAMDGQNPIAMIQGTDGNLYGVTLKGGVLPSGNGGYGTVFKLSTSGTFDQLYVFSNTTDEGMPTSLLQGQDGNFYGTTQGQTSSQSGTLFTVTPTGALTTLYTFSGNADGFDPFGLVQTKDGSIFGLADGDNSANGIIFEETLTSGATTGGSTTSPSSPSGSSNPTPSASGGGGGAPSVLLMVFFYLSAITRRVAKRRSQSVRRTKLAFSAVVLLPLILMEGCASTADLKVVDPAPRVLVGQASRVPISLASAAPAANATFVNALQLGTDAPLYYFQTFGGGGVAVGVLFGPLGVLANAGMIKADTEDDVRNLTGKLGVDPRSILTEVASSDPLLALNGSANSFVLSPWVLIVKGEKDVLHFAVVIESTQGAWKGRYTIHVPFTTTMSSAVNGLSPAEQSQLAAAVRQGIRQSVQLFETDLQGKLVPQRDITFYTESISPRFKFVFRGKLVSDNGNFVTLMGLGASQQLNGSLASGIHLISKSEVEIDGVRPAPVSSASASEAVSAPAPAVSDATAVPMPASIARSPSPQSVAPPTPAPQALTKGLTVQLTTGRQLRGQPKETGTLTQLLPAGTAVTLDGQVGDFWFVKSSIASGWISARELEQAR